VARVGRDTSNKSDLIAALAQEAGIQEINVKLFDALTTLIFDVIPSYPHRDVYLLGNTMGPAFRHWRRAKIGRRFRLFFRFDSKSRIIIFA
jgi:toxin YhaV